MGVRLKGEYYSTMGELFTWQLIDTSYGDLQHDTQLTSEGIVFDWSGEDRNKDTRFINCKATFSLMVNHTNISNFIDDFKNHNEGRFFLRVGNVSNGTTWIGKITPDGGEVEDNDYPYPFKLNAVDGIGNLKGVNYSDTIGGESPFEGEPTLLEHVFNCLDKIGTKDHYLGQDYLWIVCNYYEDQHANNTDNPLDKTRVSASVFRKQSSETNTYEYQSCIEVLRNILTNFSCTLMYAGPYYFIVQRSERENASFRVFKYSTARALVSSGNISKEVTVQNAGNVNFRKGISSFGFLPGMRSAKIIYNHGDQDVNLLSGFNYEGDNLTPQTPTPTLVEVGTVDVKNLETVILRFRGKLRYKSHLYPAGATQPSWKNHRFRFRLTLRAVDNAGAGTARYWHMDLLRTAIGNDFYSPNFTNPYWDAVSAESYDYITNVVSENLADINLFDEVGFDTSIMAFNTLHNISFKWEFIDCYDEKLQVLTSLDNPLKCEWEFSDLELVALKDGKFLDRPTKAISEVTGDLNNSYSSSEEVIIGDGPGKSSLGRLQVYNGTEWKDSALWSINKAGDSKKLHLLSASEMVAGQKTSLILVLGGFYSKNVSAISRILYSGNYYLMLSARYTTAYDDWDGEWCQISPPTRTGLVPWDKTEVNRQKVPVPINPGIKVDNERKEDRVLGILIQDRIIKNTAITSIPLKDIPTTDIYNEGDIINLINPITGDVQNIKITADVKKGDTSISIQSVTPTVDFPPGSYIEIDKKFVNNNSYSETNEEYQYEASFSGTELVCTHTLTNLTLESAAEIISKRHRVYKNGQKLIYGHAQGWSINNTGNKIVFAETCYSDSIEVYSYKVKKVYA